MIFLLWLIPIFIVVAGHLIFPRQISLKEALVVGLVCSLITFGSFILVTYLNRADTEIRNGSVTKKYRDTVSCDHCRQVCTGSGNNQTCTTVCDHFFDYDWVVQTTVGDFKVSRVDRQGISTPPRWSAVQVGEPASLEHPYSNYIKGAADSLFKDVSTTNQFASHLPHYPRVYDYHRVDRVIQAKANFPHRTEMDTLLDQLLIKLGPSKQINIIVVVTTLPQEFAIDLEARWLGAKKNDLVIVYGIQDDLSIQYVKPFTFARSSGNEKLTVEMRDELLALKDLNNVSLHVAAIERVVNNSFRRKPMSDFEYLAEESTPSAFALTIIVMLSLLAVAIGLVMSYFDLYPNQYRSRFHY